MKSLAIILVLSFAILSCKKHDEDPAPTEIIITVKNSDGSLSQIASVSVSTCTDPPPHPTGCIDAGYSAHGYTNMKGVFKVSDAKPDVYYTISAGNNAGTEGKINEYSFKLEANKTTYITIKMDVL